jgi:hypothetical protein
MCIANQTGMKRNQIAIGYFLLNLVLELIIIEERPGTCVVYRNRQSWLWTVPSADESTASKKARRHLEWQIEENQV